ncbi:helix-turn-helix domain-containing protein [Streptomyces bohaiensis]|uniref:Helix-turn-helix domain-containing protein n=1 Tax=Streptomyces bohaiensis TaxID=1431344 RepID=A0ABX1CB92_9ACTN|nr:helix-turn-helix transcriptional regulator [Streptomyces bohaiensis]NJQ15536.1 helix-turn-helix domain-containing protein [Streptomyces bohaiensis]
MSAAPDVPEAAREFAALLRLLKDRSGLSYGALAARLHVSTSSLHRYCRGESVPHDYAPAERLARACRATGPERAELHRRWVLADDERRRAAPSPVRRGDAPSVPVAAASDSSDAPDSSDGSDRAVGDAPPAGREAVGTASASGAAPAGPGEAPVRPGGRRRVGSPALAVAVAGVAVAVGLAGWWSVAGGAPAEDAESAPFSVRVRPFAYEHPCDQRLLVDRPPEVVAPPPEAGDVTAWVRDHAGVPADEQRIGLTLQGTGEETVVVEAVHVRVVERSAPLTWDEYQLNRHGCGGSVQPRPFTVDLDNGNPVLDPGEGEGGLPLTVDESDPEVLYLTARTSAHHVAWELSLEWSSGGRSGTVRVDDGGDPFRTSGAAGGTQHSFTSGTEWVSHRRQ